MSDKQSRLDTLKKKQEQLKARIQKLESLDKSQERKRDTRRKILIGAYYFDKSQEDGNLEELYALMETYLKRNSDRVLFNLAPINEATQNEAKQNKEKIQKLNKEMRNTELRNWDSELRTPNLELGT